MSSKMTGAQIAKLVVAVVLLLGAGVMIAMYLGVFDSSGEPMYTPEEQAERDQQYQEQQEEIERIQPPSTQEGSA